MSSVLVLLPAHLEHHAGIEAGHAAPFPQHGRTGKKCAGAVANPAGCAGIGSIEQCLPYDGDGKFLMSIDGAGGTKKRDWRFLHDCWPLGKTLCRLDGGFVVRGRQEQKGRRGGCFV